jgi:hypothetical protein
MTTSTNDQKFKADAGKLQGRLLFEGMPRALKLAMAFLSYGAQKYEAHSWRNVDAERYKDAKARHMIDGETEFADDESGLWHKAHELVNLMFLIELETASMSDDEFRELLVYNKPPTSHKESA